MLPEPIDPQTAKRDAEQRERLHRELAKVKSQIAERQGRLAQLSAQIDPEKHRLRELEEVERQLSEGLKMFSETSALLDSEKACDPSPLQICEIPLEKLSKLPATTKIPINIGWLMSRGLLPIRAKLSMLVTESIPLRRKLIELKKREYDGGSTWWQQDKEIERAEKFLRQVEGEDIDD
jgi:small-conductance mechanosensitive channel